jgi:LysM repeat protein
MELGGRTSGYVAKGGKHMRRLLIVGLVLLLAASVAATPHTAQAVANNTGQITVGCNQVQIDMTYDVNRNNTGTGREYHAYVVTDAAGTVLYVQPYHDPIPNHYHDVITHSYTATPGLNPITAVHISYAGNGFSEQVVYRSTGSCSGLPWAVGADQVPIPSTAVVGSFVKSTPIYSDPIPGSTINLTMAAGKTAWVYGVDPSGQFYRVMLGGTFFWVPVNTMGPNYDAVWQGRPLPGGVVVSTGTSGSQTVTVSTTTVTLTAGSFPVNSAPVNASSYTVQAGDNLFRIALHFGVKLSKLAAANGISDPSRIYVGQVLNIAAAR